LDHRAHHPFPRRRALYPVINWYRLRAHQRHPFTSKYWFPGNPWDNTEQYMKRSLTDQVGKIKTPTLV